MRILIEISGGAFVGATVEEAGGPVRIILADRDNLEAGDVLDVDGIEHETATPAEFDAILCGIMQEGL